MELDNIGGLAGGVGLFLLGMHLMTNGLRTAAGQRLSKILQDWTKTKPRGVLSGAMITSMVQSSSAVTVATLGFVNAGLMNLGQAVTVIYGSNIGTTMTAWLVALIGFHIDIKAFALPAIGIGMLLRISYAEQRKGAFGEALAGFGVFFLGIEILKSSFGDLGEAIQFSQLDPSGIELLWLVASGFAMTVVMQSSSAAMALILTAVGGGVFPLEAAAAMVVGANVGTTSTALLGVIGATPNAKRVAMAHVSFNLITGAVALAILSGLLELTLLLRETLGLEAENTIILALFHTVFNILGVILLWPFTERLVSYLSTQFRSMEEDEANPRYLDKTLLTTPALAVHALIKELGRISNTSRSAAKAVISLERGQGPRLSTNEEAITRLGIAVGEFTSALQRTNLAQDTAEALPNAVRISRYYISAMALAKHIATELESQRKPLDKRLMMEIASFKSTIVKLINLSDPSHTKYSAEECQEQLGVLEHDYQRLKKHILQAGTHGKLSSMDMVKQLELMSNIRRLAQQLEKGSRYLNDFIRQEPAEKIEHDEENIAH